MSAGPSWYDLLGVEQDASADEIRSAWRAAIADLDPSDRRFRSYNQAAEVLLDPASRAAYDAGLDGPVAPAAVRRTVLGPLLAEGNAHLLETLRAYLREGAATTAAQALHVHAQTLRYRLRRVRELTGHDPHRPWQRFVLETACAIAP